MQIKDSLSKLSNKGCPLICIKDQTVPIWIFQAGESDPNGQSVTVVGYDQTGHRPNTTKNVQAKFLKEELRTSSYGHGGNASGRLKSANS